MSPERFEERSAELLAEEAGQPMQWWWLSFVGEEGFLGAVVIEAPGIFSATIRAHEMGINPGGECAAFQVPPEVLENELPAHYRNRLLSEEVIRKEFGGKSIHELEEEDSAQRNQEAN